MVYSRKYCFKHLYMIKIPLVAFNQNETCYFVKYKVLLNVAKMSVIITMPTPPWSLVLTAQPHAWTHSMSPGTNKSLAVWQKSLSSVQCQGRDPRRSLCKTINQAQLYYGHHTNCNLSSRQQPPQGQSQDLHTQPAPKQTWDPQALNTNDKQPAGRALYLEWQTRCPLGTSGTSLRNLIYRSPNSELSENTEQRLVLRVQSWLVVWTLSSSAHQPRAPSECSYGEECSI